MLDTVYRRPSDSSESCSSSDSSTMSSILLRLSTPKRPNSVPLSPSIPSSALPSGEFLKSQLESESKSISSSPSRDGDPSTTISSVLFMIAEKGMWKTKKECSFSQSLPFLSTEMKSGVFTILLISMIIVISVIEFGILIPTLVTPTEKRLEQMKSAIVKPVESCMNDLAPFHTKMLRTTSIMTDSRSSSSLSMNPYWKRRTLSSLPFPQCE